MQIRFDFVVCSGAGCGGGGGRMSYGGQAIQL